MSDEAEDDDRLNESIEQRRERIGIEGLRDRIAPSLHRFAAILKDAEYDRVRSLLDSPRGDVLRDEAGDFCDKLGYPEDWTRGQCLACELLGGDPTETSEGQLNRLIDVVFGYGADEAHWSHEAMLVLSHGLPRRRTVEDTLIPEEG